MKFNVELGKDNCRTVIEFESGPYDGVVPAGSLFIENRLRYMTADRLAIACALLVYDFIAADIVFPLPCSPEVAREVENFFAPLNVRVLNVDFTPSRKPISLRSAALILPSKDRADIATSQAADIKFGISDDQTFQSQLSTTEILLGTNLRAYCSDRILSLGLGSLGLCILFAEDFSISSIVLPRELSREIRNLDALKRLTLQSNIALCTEV